MCLELLNHCKPERDAQWITEPLCVSDLLVTFQSLDFFVTERCTVLHHWWGGLGTAKKNDVDVFPDRLLNVPTATCRNRMAATKEKTYPWRWTATNPDLMKIVMIFLLKCNIVCLRAGEIFYLKNTERTHRNNLHRRTKNKNLTCTSTIPIWYQMVTQIETYIFRFEHTIIYGIDQTKYPQRCNS